MLCDKGQIERKRFLCHLKDRLIPRSAVSREQESVSYPPELFAGKRLLLVEDNSMNREIASAILEEAGLIVDIAENGAIAVEKVSYYPPGYYTAVLMDIQMPILDGFTAAS